MSKLDYQQILQDYLQQAQAKGLSRSQIRTRLREANWSQEAIDAAFARLKVTPKDLWQQPTWPVPAKSWASKTRSPAPPKKTPAIKTKTHVATTLPTPYFDPQQIKKRNLNRQVAAKVLALHQRANQPLIEKLSQRKQKRYQEEQQLVRVQEKAVLLAGLLGLIILFSLFWQIFVIK